MMNLPNLLTASRILLIPVFVAVFVKDSPTRSLVAALVFLVAALTDFMDGYVARRRGQTTVTGKLFDPVADKLLIISALILLVDFNRLPAWIAIVLIGREVAVTGLRAMATLEGIVIPSDRLGKAKLVIQVIAILVLILDHQILPPNSHTWGVGGLAVAMVLSLISAGQYWLTFRRGTSSAAAR